MNFRRVASECADTKCDASRAVRREQLTFEDCLVMNGTSNFDVGRRSYFGSANAIVSGKF